MVRRTFERLLWSAPHPREGVGAVAVGQVLHGVQHEDQGTTDETSRAPRRHGRTEQSRPETVTLHRGHPAWLSASSRSIDPGAWWGQESPGAATGDGGWHRVSRCGSSRCWPPTPPARPGDPDVDFMLTTVERDRPRPARVPAHPMCFVTRWQPVITPYVVPTH